MTAGWRAPQARGMSVSLLSNKMMGRRTPRACATAEEREAQAGLRTGVARRINFASRAKSATARKAKKRAPVSHVTAIRNNQFVVSLGATLAKGPGATDAITAAGPAGAGPGVKVEAGDRRGLVAVVRAAEKPCWADGFAIGGSLAKGRGQARAASSFGGDVDEHGA